MEIIRRPDKSRNDRFKVFNNENLGSVRTFNIEGEPWFCLKDVCEILEIGNPSDVKKRGRYYRGRHKYRDCDTENKYELHK